MTWEKRLTDGAGALKTPHSAMEMRNIATCSGRQAHEIM